MTDKKDLKDPKGEAGDALPGDLLPDIDDNALYRISREDYANILYKWRDAEHAKPEGGRKVIIEAIEARLKVVQGGPLA